MSLPSLSQGNRDSSERFEVWTTRRVRPPVSAARLAILYLRSRRVGWAALTVVALAAVSWAGTAWLISRPEFEVDNSGVLKPLLVLATLAAACIVGAGSGSPFGDAERTGARSLQPLRFGHLAGLLLCAAVLLAVVLLSFDLRGSVWANPLYALLRNLVGLSGMTLLAARLLGARLSWALPLFFVMAAYLGARQPDDTYAVWAWQMQPGRDGISWVFAAFLISIGLAVVCRYGARDPAGEAE